MIITIDPRIKFNYSSYYLYGILQLEGNVRIKYDIRPFIELSYKDQYEYNCGMAFLLDNQYKILPILIRLDMNGVIYMLKLTQRQIR